MVYIELIYIYLNLFVIMSTVVIYNDSNSEYIFLLLRFHDILFLQLDIAPPAGLSSQPMPKVSIARLHQPPQHLHSTRLHKPLKHPVIRWLPMQPAKYDFNDI